MSAMRRPSNRTLVLVLAAFVVVSICAGLSVLRSPSDGEARFPILLMGSAGEPDYSFFQAFRQELTSRHPQLAARIQWNALVAVDADDEYIRELQRAALQRPALIVARNGFQAELAHRFAPEISLVFSSYTDPRKLGVVSSLTSRNERATGLWIDDEMDAKRIEVLLDAYPTLRHVGLIADQYWWQGVGDGTNRLQSMALERGVELSLVQVESVEEALRSIDSPQARHIQAWCLPRTLLSVDGRLVRHLAAQGKPVMVAHTPDIHIGAHLSYAQDKRFAMPALVDLAARIAYGEPAESIPIQTPQRYQLAVRISADRRLPPLDADVIRRADVVIRP